MNSTKSKHHIRMGRRARLMFLAPLIACGAQAPPVAQDLIQSAPVAIVAVNPTILTIAVGITAAVSATPKDASGVPVTNSNIVFASSAPSVASVNPTGAVTGVSAGSATITASVGGQNGFIAVSVSSPAGPTTPPAPTTPPPTTPPTPPPTVPPGSGSPTVANPVAFPAASGQLKNLTAYTSLNVSILPAGSSYTDPVTGAKVWKVTSPTVPTANTYIFHSYSEGPAQISREYNGKHTLWIFGPGGGIWFIDFNRSTGLFNYRAAPAGTLQASFAKNPATPSIVYLVTSARQIRRFDVATSSFADIAPFPAAFNGNQWFAQDMTDTRFIAISIASTSDVLFFDRSTGTTITRTFAGLDEPYLEHNGRYVMANTSLTNVSIWDLQTNTVAPLTAPGNSIFAHVGSARGYFIAVDPNTGGGQTPLWAVDPSATRASFQFSTLGGYYPDSHASGSWVQSDIELGNDLKKQWILRETFDFSFAGTGTSGVKEGIAMLTLDGLNFRIAAHHYSVKPPATASSAFAYYSQPRTTISIDGKLIMFDSNMNGSARTDVFLVEMPVR